MVTGQRSLILVQEGWQAQIQWDYIEHRHSAERRDGKGIWGPFPILGRVTCT